MGKYNVASLFAGVGGVDFGFKLAGATPVWANEIDEYASLTFSENHKSVDLRVDDIKNIKGEELPLGLSILTAGFPCQAFSVAGNRGGFNDERGALFNQITRLIVELDEHNNKPQVIFIENVKNLLNHDEGKSLKRIMSELENLGYNLTYKILNTMKYGNLPQNRERIYIVGFLDKSKLNNFAWPERKELTKKLNDVINRDIKVDNKYYYTSYKTKYYDMLKKSMHRNDTVYQLRRVYVRENKSNVCPTLTANMGTGGHNVPLILDNKENIRKLTPRECFGLQGFPSTYKFPENMSDTRLYKQAGNSVSVSVISSIAKEILKVL